jgi:hypothetical protein
MQKPQRGAATRIGAPHPHVSEGRAGLAALALATRSRRAFAVCLARCAEASMHDGQRVVRFVALRVNVAPQAQVRSADVAAMKRRVAAALMLLAGG